MGKKTRSAEYWHRSAVPPELRSRMDQAELAAHYPCWTVVKFHNNKDKVTLLDYPTFWSCEHPALQESWTVNLETGVVRHAKYKPTTAPILHRKELFVDPKVELRHDVFADLTRAEEQEGLLDNPPGRRDTWFLFLESRGYLIDDHKLYKMVTI